jgi:RhtB (resistance to homoserine/threonine) family protein
VFSDYLPSIIALTVVQLLGVMSPGPDFAVVVRNSLVYTRKTGVLTALGVSLGILVHLAYILLGLGIVISKTIWLFHLFKYLGAGYLMYIGIKGLLAKKQVANFGENAPHLKDPPAFTVIRSSFLVNVMNPKAMLFFLSLISAFVTPAEPTMIIILYGVIIFMSTLIWFSFIAICFSNQRLRAFFKNFQYVIERITGGLLILLGVNMLFAEVPS